ncbi:hypothetical protein FJV80_04305 [Mesorhizobium sp. WSM4310]|uniref:hypothetical protein n=1 Tax=Mesorhizobium sp. WSM4310 TaxID=2589883 RepID=UPI00115D117B|nr:hypothetical protein [Mesorhizobium sp. WSM4310]TRC91150.1 hypothetical protein FJV80_04305 [Mesorhizobium sp. WSM4310]
MNSYWSFIKAEIKAATPSILSYLYYLQYVGVGALVFYGLVVLGAQLFVFLRSAKWVALSLTEMISRIDYDWIVSQWAGAPQSWLGLHWLLSQIPASVAFFGCAVIWVIAWVSAVAYRRSKVIHLESAQ